MDFVSCVTAENLRAKLLALGEVEVVSVYAVGGTHFAWYRKKKEKVSLNKDSSKGK